MSLTESVRLQRSQKVRRRSNRPLPLIPKDTRPSAPGEECIVCRDEPPHFPKDAPTATCAHQSQVCLVCLRRTINEAVTNGIIVTGIHCPSADCTQLMAYTDVQRWASEETLQRYDRAMLSSALMADPDFIRCLNPQCGAGQIHTGNDNPLVTCYACKAKQCWNHQTVWHTDYTCKKWDKLNRKNRRLNDASIDAIHSLTKACPAPSCGRRLMKADGCDHFTCQPPGGCGHQFCWLCLAPWEPIRLRDNSRHYDHCKYYSGKPGAHPSPFREAKKRWWYIKSKR
ncbi:hypothetical protein M408DRAFT_277262 [Serendipita vermifera MAFF 305830]|uniref:RBR-type E3 ubiquitin transferase n=1 Tax=Serendipita vermifera MAFF 305830 TaxID=933852 RepID=A0A0C3AL07_SERVB|nr:hypothetical protein M408DRAFT_168151 [Serendipita vermifera MAFF 305830]KIM22913.1 hypothetical protein M408DRAFT_277262 [Serendipita vermifera MAFF 305830]